MADSKTFLPVFLTSFFLFNSCAIAGENWHCVIKKEKGRMLRWTDDFVQYGQYVYFDKRIDPKHYQWKAPDFSTPNKGPYQDPLEWGVDMPKSKYSSFPYNIKKTKQQVSLQYLMSKAIVYTLYEMPSGEFLFASDNPFDKLRAGEIDYFTDYFSHHVVFVDKIHFDIPSKTLTETTTYMFTPHTQWQKRQVKKTGKGQIYSEPEKFLTPNESERLYHRVMKNLGGFPKYVEQTSVCKKDNFITSYFRYMGNSLFKILRY